PFNEDLADREFSSKLPLVKTPMLLLYGKYDFICPPALGQDIFDQTGSAEKSIYISEKSGHSPMIQDPEWFCREVNQFVEAYR
ncbi:MAG: alpha/beta hydrolase, partial [Bacteroidota bacterium]